MRITRAKRDRSPPTCSASASAAAVCARLADELEVALERARSLREQCLLLPLTLHLPLCRRMPMRFRMSTQTTRATTAHSHADTHPRTNALTRVQVQREHARHSCTRARAQAWITDTDTVAGRTLVTGQCRRGRRRRCRRTQTEADRMGASAHAMHLHAIPFSTAAFQAQ